STGGARCESSQQRSFDIGGTDGTTIMEAGVGPKMKGVYPAIGAGFPAARQSWLQSRIRIELGQVVEEKGNDLSGGHVGGQGGIQRSWIVAEIVVEGFPAPLVTTGRQDQKSGEQKSAHGELDGPLATDGSGKRTRRTGGARGRRRFTNVDTAT